MNFLFNNTNTNPYLSVYTVGYEETQPSHSYGPAVRSGYMFIISTRAEVPLPVKVRFTA